MTSRAPSTLEGVLLIDKPSGLTSHDVVALVRRVLHERSIGHTGTLDPMASGLLPLVVGRATRLASVLAGRDKTYDATIRFGFGTDTDDALGEPIGAVAAAPSDSAIAEGLAAFRGTFDQRPPAHSAKKIGGVKAYDLARRARPVPLAPVPVTVRSLEWLERQGDQVSVRVTVTAGFYVRALARDLGAALGCGAHLSALRRLRSGAFEVADAISLVEAERLAGGLSGRLIPPADALPDLAFVVVTADGLRRALHGNPLGAGHLASSWPAAASAGGPELRVKVIGPDGRLVALARPDGGGALHPVVVLG
jgi:tRNA pseudouridine55 synthase